MKNIPLDGANKQNLQYSLQ